jgi:hypothetical protein
MRPARQLIASTALLLAAGPALVLAQVQAREGEWVSYRDAYRVMVAFEKYGGPKHFLRNQLRVVPKERGEIDGLQLTLAGKSTQLNLPLDPLGRTVFPLQKAAYDENAVLVLNRKGATFALRPQVSIAVRPDGMYDGADLRAACGEALGFARWLDASQRSRQCAGVRFVFPKKAEGGARLRHDGTEQALPALPGPAFAGDVDENFPTVTYRFGSAEHAQVVTHDAPLAIVPVFE